MLWGALICGVLLILSPAQLRAWFFKPTTSITLTMPDANALTRGSAVNLAGVNVGRVDKVRIVDAEQVAVTLKLKPDAPPLPKQSRATVVFTGLGGVKTVEIEVPTQQERLHNDKLGASAGPLQVQSPVRLQEVLNYQTETSLTLQHGAEALEPLVDYELQPAIKQQLVQGRNATHQAVQTATQLNQELDDRNQQLLAIGQSIEGRTRPLASWLGDAAIATNQTSLQHAQQSTQQGLATVTAVAQGVALGQWPQALNRVGQGLPSPLAVWQWQFKAKLGLGLAKRGLSKQLHQLQGLPNLQTPIEAGIQQGRTKAQQAKQGSKELNESLRR
jgi:ABC-type transporter Mla subunit MlaD